MKQHAAAAGWLSALCMGLGQWYNRQYAKGWLFILIHAAGLYLTIFKLAPLIKDLTTLGTQGRHFEKVGKINRMVEGDNSLYMMIYGVLAVLVLLLYIFLYIQNIRDAVAIGRRREQDQDLQKLNSSFFPWLLLTLPIIGVLAFTILPIVFTSLISFTNYASPNHIPPKGLIDWVGFSTYHKLFNLNVWQDTFFGVLGWTVFWAVTATFTCYFGGILVALLINQQGIRFKGFWRFLFIIPYAIPQFVSLLIMRNMLNEKFGPINQYFQAFGLQGLPWLNDPFWAKVSVIVVNMWIGIPVSMVLVMGILTTIPKDLYEAAEVDGASVWMKFRNITMPYILFATAPILITQFVGNVNSFNVVFLLTGGGPATMRYNNAGETDLLVTWLYKLTLDFNQYNIAAAVAVLLFLFVATMSILVYTRTRSFREEDMIQ
ncbi:sugar ABC transporter permease [Cohnella pontilimi]|uniref:Maltose/maltodextrin transport system permease protein n=1 Tax=Cohnella pontilimi TaxID=2564100 RepID=A0A4V5LS35_9BACL|nr:sugar ABC transporter permease [Cohnella pontilimi]TJY41519.1 sugar ABC transporter permease [Cohnella pontilimi]